MADPSLALQTALYQRLTEECTAPVYDSVPDDAPYPYITLDSEHTINQSPLKGTERDERLFYLSIWSDYQGQAEVKRLLGEIRAAVNRRPLPLTTGRVLLVNYLRGESIREPDGVTFMGSVTLQIILTH